MTDLTLCRCGPDLREQMRREATSAIWSWHNARCPIHQIGYYQTQDAERELRRAYLFERLRGLLDYLNVEPTDVRETIVAIDECLSLHMGTAPILSAETSAMLCCGSESADHVRDIEREHYKKGEP